MRLRKARPARNGEHARMALLTWSESLALGHAQMDATHVEFVDRLAALEAALAGGDATDALAALVAHTEAHFAQEDRWMAALGFGADTCHAFQHRSVLNVLREVQRLHAEKPDLALLQRLARELAQWFPVHARTMDAGLAATMAERGFEPAPAAA
ncbi:MAG: hypothetical protein Fur0014_16880 [Rubrivivax sp.]